MASGKRDRESAGPATLGSTLAAHPRLIFTLVPLVLAFCLAFLLIRQLILYGF
jgi:hypothetical protein